MLDILDHDIPHGQERMTLRIENGVGLLTLCRPEQLNGWSWESSRQLGIMADRLRFDDSVRAVLLRGEGRAFCAGIDVTAPGGDITGRTSAERTQRYYEGIRWVHERFAAFAGLPQPVIAAVQGYCLGFGFELALMADIRIAADNAVFALPEAGIGVAVDAGGDMRIAREAGAGWAKYLALTGRRIDAAAAERIGLLQAVTPLAELERTARSVAEEVAANAPLAVRHIKRSVDAYADAGLGEALDRTALAAALTLTSQDAAEGYAAKAARRPPHFEGT
ncbi:enoyl-CoA hydratase/isomerase family protein [Streptomyces poriferorum]|uniref:enoyl-CoA hydratase/isomerase family protein n=1 Tax=Streptomyces TaxID=1883 RepID=UPI001C5CD22F|nr:MULTISPECIES: enoyl-CoA hydratase/isomerase family protein [Streptomyces]MBW5249519.1 enoyl-CoA hydratase/isomerase family protein [Streptomyces poriferorum]MBW5260119.1 enoyl-CoA hydratase/isomerase family protein [Streptomyces poriferorum]WLQ52926.1 enoyl-CoA hydratase/isomerase family protein [Streptomyces sp. Alt1]